jgi:hypothetical protein
MVRPPIFACKATGRALQLACAITAAARADTREMLLYQALRELPTVPRLLQWLPASADPGARAAATLLAVATYRFYLQQIGAAVPRRLRHPLWTALAAACSRRSYLATVDAVADSFRDALDALATRLDGPADAPAPVSAPDTRDASNPVPWQSAASSGNRAQATSADVR